MSSSGSTATTYTVADEHSQDKTIIRQRIETSILTAAEQIATYFYEDLTEFARKTGVDVEYELCGTHEFETAREGFLTRLCSDIDRLLCDDLITSMILILSDPVNSDGKYKVRYRAIYNVQRSPAAALARSGSAIDVQRQGGFLDPPRHAGAGARFSLIVDWNPLTREKRAIIEYPRYHFKWAPILKARFDESQLAATYRYGSMTPTVGDLIVTRLEAAAPEYLRGRRVSQQP